MDAGRTVVSPLDQTETQALREADRAHHLHPFTDPAALAQAGAFVVQRGEGVYLYGEGGIRLLDAMAGLACVNIGYGRPEMAEVAARSMTDLAYYPVFSAVTHPAAAALAAKLAALAPGDLNRVFFANSGSEANETIVKLARLYWRTCGQPDKTVIIGRDYGYHGSTLYTASLNGLAYMHEPFGLPLDGVAHVTAPYWYRHGGEQDPAAFGLAAARALEDRIVELGADRVAAFIAEPIQATAGAIVPPETYWPEIVRICAEHDVLLIADEVVTGFGRTGTWFAQEPFGFQADFMTIAKGLSSAYQPIAGALVSDRVAQVIAAAPGPFQHGFTTSAHPVAAAVALKNIEILETESLVQRVAEDIGPYFQDRLASLADHPLVGEVRGMGLLAGIELVADKAARQHYPLERGVCGLVSNAALLEGVIVRPTGNSLVIAPPLVISRQEVDAVIAGLAAALDKAVADLGA